MSHNAPICNRNMHTCAHFCYKMRHCGIFICALWDLWRGYSRSRCTRVEIFFFKDGHEQLSYVPNIWLFMKMTWHTKLSALLALCEGNPSVTSDIPRWNMHCNTTMYQQLQCEDTLRVIRLFWHIAILTCYTYAYILPTIDLRLWMSMYI